MKLYFIESKFESNMFYIKKMQKKYDLYKQTFSSGDITVFQNLLQTSMLYPAAEHTVIGVTFQIDKVTID